MNRLRSALMVAAFNAAIGLPCVASLAAAQDDADAAEWCTSHGGTVVERYPASNTASNPPVALGPAISFCEFTGGEGADPESSISVRADTLAATEPSMAATAYLTKPEAPESSGSASPAALYCADLGGAQLGGVLAPSGGWVNATDATDILDGLCVFPDLSIIDAWGLSYHTAGTIRGADLEPLFGWKPASES
ncbi:MAG: hypothetical protein H0V00_16525 [Chloroflexia bacterium]|nr:hypothetical protein [Chloroflexia bacterium]